ncbi:MAG TPA: LysR substrate-binding domain-containing protein [Steroidobacteraceae bacterium]|nr:LysR substrate-binding domain-containing protein [Steroidobacteraceae bacterium]
MRVPSLKFLRTFQVAAARQSFKAAADELCITPSAVSHQVKALETQLGIQLFERGPHSLLLTEAGNKYAQSLESIFNRLEDVTEQLRQSYSRGVVRLHVPPFFASEMLMPRLQTFMQMQPDMDIHINTVGGTLQSHPAEADLSVVVNAVPSDGLISYRLFEQAFVPACSPQLKDEADIRSIDDLRDQTLLIHEARRDGWQRWAELSGRSNLQPRNIVRFDTMQATVQAAESGVGVALVSTRLGSTRFRLGSLIKLFDTELPTGEAYYLIHRPEDASRSDVKVLTRWLLSEFADPMSKAA